MKTLSTLLISSAMGLVAISAAKADSYDKMTKITVNEPVRLPTMTLQPGNYSLRLLEATGNRHVVQVRDENGKGLGLILALPNYRMVAKDSTVLQYWETPPGQPRAVRAWFFPGDNVGQEFVYPQSEAAEIAAYTGGLLPDISVDLTTTVVDDSNESNSQPSGTVSVAELRGESTEAPVVSGPSTPSQPEPQLIAQVTPPPTLNVPPADAAPAQLPQTASDLPLIGLVGVLSLAASLTTLGGKRRV